MPQIRATVVVLGATGRVGRLILAEWARNPPAGLRVRGQRRMPAGAPLSGADPFVGSRAETGWIRWELADGPARLAATIGPNVAALVVLAGITPAPAADYPANSALALAALQAAALAGVRHVFTASSAALYGRGAGKPLAETADPAPASAYGAAKLAMEQACTGWCAKNGGPGLTHLRIGNVAGTDQFFRALTGATTAAPLRLDRFPDGSGPVRSYIGPASLAHVLHSLCLRAAAAGAALLPDVLNIAAPGSIDMADFGPALLGLGQPAPIIRVAAPPDALPSLLIDTARLQALHTIPPGQATPAAMLAEWLGLRAAP